MCVFGLSTYSQGYKLYDVLSKQMFISHDVFFHEEVSFYIVAEAEQVVDPFPDVV